MSSKKNQGELAKERLEHDVHPTLERGLRVHESERHHQELEVAVMVWKAVFSTSPGCTCTWWQPDHKSSLVKKWVSLSSSRSSSTMGMGNLSLTVRSFSAR